MKYLYETHFHTSDVSPCGQVSAADGSEMYKAAGYSGVLVTDHFATRYLNETLKGDTWKEKIDSYLKGYYEAKKHETDDFSVMLGMEARFDENANDYLLIGIDESFIYNNEGFNKMKIKEFKKLAEKNSVLVIQAHPFRTCMTVNDPHNIDGVEVFNGNKRHNSSNEITDMWAERFGFIKTSGSDFHQKEDLARGGIYTQEKITDSKQLRSVLLSGKYDLKRL